MCIRSYREQNSYRILSALNAYSHLKEWKAIMLQYKYMLRKIGTTAMSIQVCTLEARPVPPRAGMLGRGVGF
jgi:hypothetical protein